METAGHHEISEVGEAVLREALRVAGKGQWRTGAFYLGNWITDVQQGIDPRGFDEVATSLRDASNTLVRRLEGMRGSHWERWLRDQAMPHMREFQSNVNSVARALTGGRSSSVANLLHNAFIVRGYFEFVHPRRGRSGARMDYSAYRHVIDNGFGQYFPHEHLDRFPTDTSSIARATVTPSGRGTGHSSIEPGIYSYLQSDIQICAGLIAELDRDWARRTFSRSGESWEGGDTNHDWNFKLAQLGHAVHAIEDFFAHSNFVEHAWQSSGRSIPGGHAGEIIRKRLKRMSGTPRDNNDEWERLPEETAVVTGYFDKWDTLHSLAHVVEELDYGRHAHASPPSRHSHGLEVGKLIVKIVHRMRDARPTRQEAERVLRDLASRGNPDVDSAVVDAANQVLNHLPSEARAIRDMLLDEAVQLAHRLPGSTMTLLDAMIFIQEFYENLMYPLRFVEWCITELPPECLRWVVEHTVGAATRVVQETVERAIRRIIEEELNRFRVGCHSLMAKDYRWPNEPAINRTHEAAIAIAKSVHWYVIKSLSRHAAGRTVPASRGDPDQDNGNTVSEQRWIDWLELLETFLRHPMGSPPNERSVPAGRKWWAHVFEQGDHARFPGFDGEQLERRPNLPHSLVPLTQDQMNAQIQTASRMRTQAERTYNRGTSTR